MATSTTLKHFPKAIPKTLFIPTNGSSQNLSHARNLLPSPARSTPHGSRSLSTSTSESPSDPILRRRRHMPSFPQRKPTPSSIRFIVHTKSSFHGQTEIERHFHGALTCLHRILGDVPYGWTQSAVSRTPIQMSPGKESCKGSMLAFRVFNASGELRDRIAKELMEVEGINGVEVEEDGRNEAK